MSESVQAAANKLARELAAHFGMPPCTRPKRRVHVLRFDVYGKPYPIFPPGRPPKESSPDVIEIDDDGVTMQWKPPASTGKKAVKEYVVHMKVQDQDFKVIKKMPPPSPEELKAAGNKVRTVLPIESGGCVYKAGATCQRSGLAELALRNARSSPSWRNNNGSLPLSFCCFRI